MLIQCDASGLEWVCGNYLCQDPVGIKEIWDKIDQHADNQARFNLPDRPAAKRFIFKLIYGGTPYGYSVDPDFASVGYSKEQWEEVIFAFYRKYKGWDAWHTAIVKEAMTTGQLVMPTGRIYKFQSYRVEQTGELKWPRTTILNYPVQGLGADIMSIARVSFFRRFNALGLRGLLISSVHDSIVLDVPAEEVDVVANLFHEVFDSIPGNFEKLFKKEFNLPLRCEVKVGHNLRDMLKLGRGQKYFGMIELLKSHVVSRKDKWKGLEDVEFNIAQYYKLGIEQSQRMCYNDVLFKLETV